MKTNRRSSLLALLLCAAPLHAQDKAPAAPPTDGFPPLPTFNLNDYADPRERQRAKEAIQYFELTLRTPEPLKPEVLSPVPPGIRLGEAAFEVLSPQPIWGTFALASLQNNPQGYGITNFSFKKFDKSLQASQMFYRRDANWSNFNSPLFSPNGEKSSSEQVWAVLVAITFTNGNSSVVASCIRP